MMKMYENAVATLNLATADEHWVDGGTIVLEERVQGGRRTPIEWTGELAVEYRDRVRRAGRDGLLLGTIVRGRVGGRLLWVHLDELVDLELETEPAGRWSATSRAGTAVSLHSYVDGDQARRRVADAAGALPGGVPTRSQLERALAVLIERGFSAPSGRIELDLDKYGRILRVGPGVMTVPLGCECKWLDVELGVPSNRAWADYAHLVAKPGGDRPPVHAVVECVSRDGASERFRVVALSVGARESTEVLAALERYTE